MDKKAFGRNLAGLRDESQLTQEELARMIGVQRSTLAGWESGHRMPKIGHIEVLARIFRVSIDRLYGRDHETIAEAITEYSPISRKTSAPLTVEQKFSNIEGTPQKVKFIPLIGTVVAGRLSFAAQHIEGQIAVPEYWNLDFALKIRGDSLVDKGIFEGDIAVCVKYDGQTVNPGDLVVVTRQDDATVKFLAQNDGRWVLRAANPKYPDIPMNSDDRIQAIVIKIMRDAPRMGA